MPFPTMGRLSVHPWERTTAVENMLRPNLNHVPRHTQTQTHRHTDRGTGQSIFHCQTIIDIEIISKIN